MKFSTDIHVPIRMNPNIFGDPQIFSSSTIIKWKYNLSNISVHDETPAKPMASTSAFPVHEC